MSTPTGRDRLRELLDAVLDEDNRTLAQMAGGAHASPYHFSRLLSRDVGEAPVALRRRVMLERAAWRLREGASVTQCAWEAGYESLEGFSRAFSRAYGHAPSESGENTDASAWLPAANGIHFHPPTSLWVHSTEQSMNPVTDQLVRHDLDDTRALLEHAKGLSEADWQALRMPGHQVASWEGPEESIAAVLERAVFAKEVWLAAIEGTDFPVVDRTPGPVDLLARHDAVAGRWLATIRDIDRRGAWDDRIIDALCDPPESFVLSSIVTHVLTFGAHRRLLARVWLGGAGVLGAGDLDAGDPINWLRRTHDESDDEPREDR